MSTKILVSISLHYAIILMLLLYRSSSPSLVGSSVMDRTRYKSMSSLSLFSFIVQYVTSFSVTVPDLLIKTLPYYPKNKHILKIIINLSIHHCVCCIKTDQYVQHILQTNVFLMFFPLARRPYRSLKAPRPTISQYKVDQTFQKLYPNT